MTTHIHDLTRIPQVLAIRMCTRNDVKSIYGGKMIGISMQRTTLSYELTRGKPLAANSNKGLNLTGKPEVILHTLESMN